MNTYDFGHKTLPEVVERINYGPVSGFAHLTPEYLAASYAVEAALDDLEPAMVDADTIQYHLDLLKRHGAGFDDPEAQELVSIALAAHRKGGE